MCLGHTLKKKKKNKEKEMKNITNMYICKGNDTVRGSISIK